MQVQVRYNFSTTFLAAKAVSFDCGKVRITKPDGTSLVLNAHEVLEVTAGPEPEVIDADYEEVSDNDAGVFILGYAEETVGDGNPAGHITIPDSWPYLRDRRVAVEYAKAFSLMYDRDIVVFRACDNVENTGINTIRTRLD